MSFRDVSPVHVRRLVSIYACSGTRDPMPHRSSCLPLPHTLLSFHPGVYSISNVGPEIARRGNAVRIDGSGLFSICSIPRVPPRPKNH